MTPRAIISVIRAAFYAGLGTVLGIKAGTLNELIIPAVTGAVAADMLTWLIRSIALLPEFLSHGLFDAVVNVGFGWFFLAVFGLGINSKDPNVMSVGFITFLLVLAVKTAYYSIEYLDEDLDDD